MANGPNFELSSKRIKELKDAGYSVYPVVDTDPMLYAWKHDKSGATQSYYKSQQPFRRSEAQAWVDCDAYCSGSMPSKAEPDWCGGA
ncbi:hypothetical protein ACXIUT_20790 [Achromobacter denitrificans]